MSIEFLLTSLIVVLLPGTGVIYTLSIALSRGASAGVLAALGCTIGIVPHLFASVFGIATILHTSAVVFHVFKIFGVVYLVYLARSMWKDSGKIEVGSSSTTNASQIVSRGFLINILNPKLSIFFLAFLPQFVSPDTGGSLHEMLTLSVVFMLMTFAVFVGYGVMASQVRAHVLNSPIILQRIQKMFAGLFVALGFKLAFTEL